VTEPKVFDYNDPIEFLSASLQASQKQNPRFSMRAWAGQLGLPHVAMLSMVLGRKRKLLPTLSSRVSQHYLATGRFDETQARYFDMLVLFSNARNEEEKIFYQKILSSLRPDRQFSTLSLDHFRVVSDWYHLAIVEMTQLSDFKSDLRWISLRLGGSVNEGQVQEAIDRLIRVGLLERMSEGGLRKATSHYATSSDIPSRAIRSFHRQMIQKALEALESQSVAERDITAHIVTISRSKLPEAKEMIRDFRRKLAEFLETPGGDAVYQLNVQLFDALAKGKEDVQGNQ
jgi:uncharacterized protein (TIGR02147 family)